MPRHCPTVHRGVTPTPPPHPPPLSNSPAFIFYVGLLLPSLNLPPGSSDREQETPGAFTPTLLPSCQVMEGRRYQCHTDDPPPGCNQPHSTAGRGTHTAACLPVPICLSHHRKRNRHRTRHQLPSPLPKTQAHWFFLHRPVPVSVRVPSVTIGSVKGGRGCLLSSLRDESLEVGTRQLIWTVLPAWCLPSKALSSHSLGRDERLGLGRAGDTQQTHLSWRFGCSSVGFPGSTD